MKQKITYFLIFILTFLSTILPTSINGNTVNNLSVRNGIICFSILILLFFMLNKLQVYKKILISNIIILLSLFISTIISPFSEIRVGALLFYLSFIIITLTNYSKISNIFYIKLIQILSIPIFIFSFLTIKANPAFRQFLISNYSAYYDSLVNNMFSSGKPVTFFASHSIAGFIYFLFFYINFEDFKIRKSIFSLAISIIYLFLLFYLSSVTSLMLLVVSIIYIVFSVIKSRSGYILFSIGLILIVLINFNFLSSKIELITSSLNTSFSSSTNGFTSRYSGDAGVFNYNIEFIKNNPFRPVGFSYSPELRFVDSGFIEYVLRGGIILMFAMYYSLYNFLKINIKDNRQAILLFLFFLAFEFGFAGLVAPRIVYLIPIIVISLNSIKIEKKENSILNGHENI